MEAVSKNNTNKRKACLKNGIITKCSIKGDVPDNESTQIDIKSTQGKFGWFSLNSECHLPFIFRETTSHYYSQRIAIITFKKIFPILSNEVYNYMNYKTIPMTAGEAKLFNEINQFHCEKKYGPTKFKANESMIHELDIIQMHKFLSFCLWKLDHRKISDEPPPCGYLRATSQRFVLLPFVNWGDPLEKYIPVFLVAEVTDATTAMQKIDGWPLAYLKLLCCLQNISKEFLEDTFMSMVPFATVQNHFKDCNLEVYWPDNEFRDPFLNIKVNKENKYQPLPKQNRNTTTLRPPGKPKPLPPPAKNSVPNCEQSNQSDTLPNNLLNIQNPMIILQQMYDSKFNVVQIFINKKYCKCIMNKESANSSPLVTLNELQTKAFNNVSMDKLTEAIGKVNIQKFIPNPEQYMFLLNNKLVFIDDGQVLLLHALKIIEKIDLINVFLGN